MCVAVRKYDQDRGGSNEELSVTKQSEGEGAVCGQVNAKRIGDGKRK